MSDVVDWIGKPVYDKDEQHIGVIADLYIDDEADMPTWATVAEDNSDHQHFVPLLLACEYKAGVMVAVNGDKVQDAPSIKVGEALMPDDEELLYKHYVGHHNSIDEDGNRQSLRKHE